MAEAERSCRLEGGALALPFRDAHWRGLRREAARGVAGSGAVEGFWVDSRWVGEDARR